MTRLRTDIVQVHPFRVVGGRLECLVLHRSAAEPDYPDAWQVITGAIEPQETASEAALREVIEETGIVPVSLVPFEVPSSYYLPDRDQIVLSPTFACRIDGEGAIVLCDEHDRGEWLDPSAALGRLTFQAHRDGTRALIEWWGRQNHVQTAGHD